MFFTLVNINLNLRISSMTLGYLISGIMSDFLTDVRSIALNLLKTYLKTRAILEHIMAIHTYDKKKTDIYESLNSNPEEKNSTRERTATRAARTLQLEIGSTRELVV